MGRVEELEPVVPRNDSYRRDIRDFRLAVLPPKINTPLRYH